MTDLGARLRRDMEGYARTRPVARPPLDELLARAGGAPAPSDPSSPSSARRSDRPRRLLTAATLAAVVAVAVVAGVVGRQRQQEPALTAGQPDLACAPLTQTDAGAAAGTTDASDGLREPGAPAGRHDDVLLFVRRDLTDDERVTLTEAIETDPRIAAYRYVGESEATEEFRRLFHRNQAMLDRIEQNPHLVPVYYRLQLLPASRQDAEAVVSELGGMVGVLRATSAPSCR
jgi:hypothetical protein